MQGTADYAVEANRFSVDPDHPNRIHLMATTFVNYSWIQIYLAAPGEAPIQEGVPYEGARDLEHAGSGDAVVDVVLASGGEDCDSTTGSFIVRDMEFDAGNTLLMRLDATITFACDSRPDVPAVIEYRLLTAANPINALVPSPAGFTPRWDAQSFGFPQTLVGSQGIERLVTYTAHGAAPVTVSDVAIEGVNAADWTVTQDTCSGATVAVGATCTVGVRLAPTIPGNLDAKLVVTSDATAAPSEMAMEGSALSPTTTTLTLLRNPNYFPQKPRVRVTVTPNPGGGEVCAVEPGHWDWKCVPIDADGITVFDANYMESLTGQLKGTFSGVGMYAASESAPKTQQQRNGSKTTLTSAVNPQEVTKGVILTATAERFENPDPLIGGTLSIVDETAGVTLATKPITMGPTLALTVPMSMGTHTLVARYTGWDVGANYQTVGPSQATLTQTVVADTKVDLTATGVDLATFYPAADGYRDTVRASGRLGERASVTFDVISKATGKIVRTEKLVDRPARGYGWSWDGRTAAGALLPAGAYTIRQTVVDGVANKIAVSNQVTLAGGTIAWKTITLTQTGSAFVASGTTPGGYAAVGGAYSKGGTVNSGSATGGYAAVVYGFTGPSAVAYRTVTMKVFGRTVAGAKVWEGIWNPSLGDEFDRGSYDTWGRGGTAYGGYPVTATGEDHRSSRSVFGVVEARFDPRMGGASGFDIEKVQMTIVYGSWAP